MQCIISRYFLSDAVVLADSEAKTTAITTNNLKVFKDFKDLKDPIPKKDYAPRLNSSQGGIPKYRRD